MKDVALLEKTVAVVPGELMGAPLEWGSAMGAWGCYWLVLVLAVGSSCFALRVAGRFVLSDDEVFNAY